jgi:3-methylcrotonyl-CoA carboxylase alpha subunit
MGSKARPRRMMEAAGVPLTPGYHGDEQDPAAARAAEEIGFPVLLKASPAAAARACAWCPLAAGIRRGAGGGAARGDLGFRRRRMLVEKYLERPRHIEVQVFCDSSRRRIVHLFERDCSVQRRHQKVIEEAPAPGMTQPCGQRWAKRRSGGPRHRLRRGRHGGVPAGPGRRILFHGNEHPPAGRTPGDRDDHRLDLVEWQLRVAAASRCRWRRRRLRDRRPRLRGAHLRRRSRIAISCPAAGTLNYLRRRRESGHVRSTAAFGRATRSASSTTR